MAWRALALLNALCSFAYEEAINIQLAIQHERNILRDDPGVGDSSAWRRRMLPKWVNWSCVAIERMTRNAVAAAGLLPSAGGDMRKSVEELRRAHLRLVEAAKTHLSNPREIIAEIDEHLPGDVEQAWHAQRSAQSKMRQLLQSLFESAASES